MDRIRTNSSMWWVVAVAMLLFGIWSQQHAQSAALTPAIEVKTVALEPARIPVVTASLAGHLEGLAVTTRVDKKTGKPVDTPDLQATLRLRNATADQALRLLSGTVEYRGADGAQIPLAKDQGSSAFSFFPDQESDVLPGHAMSQAIRVPFPAAALKANTLRNIRLHLTYRATPYRNETVDSPPVTLAG
jgi:hypothetical protein